MAENSFLNRIDNAKISFKNEEPFTYHHSFYLKLVFSFLTGLHFLSTMKSLYDKGCECSGEYGENGNSRSFFF